MADPRATSATPPTADDWETVQTPSAVRCRPANTLGRNDPKPEKP